MPRSLTVSNSGLYHEQCILIERPVLNFQFFHQKSHQNSKEFPYELKFSRLIFSDTIGHAANIETNIQTFSNRPWCRNLEVSKGVETIHL